MNSEPSIVYEHTSVLIAYISSDLKTIDENIL